MLEGKKWLLLTVFMLNVDSFTFGLVNSSSVFVVWTILN